MIAIRNLGFEILLQVCLNFAKLFSFFHDKDVTLIPDGKVSFIFLKKIILFSTMSMLKLTFYYT